MPTPRKPRKAKKAVPAPVADANATPVPDHDEFYTVRLSRLGASKGGHARAAALSPAQRKAAARKAAEARWKKAKSE